MTEGYDSTKTISKFISPNKLATKPFFTFRPEHLEADPLKPINASFGEADSEDDG